MSYDWNYKKQCFWIIIAFTSISKWIYISCLWKYIRKFFSEATRMLRPLTSGCVAEDVEAENAHDWRGIVFSVIILSSKTSLSRNWKNMLFYKRQQAGKIVWEVNERFTTQVCSACGNKTGPTGFEQLAVREWQCSVCKTEHDRDINSAINIAVLGREHSPPFAETISSLDLTVFSAISASRKQGAVKSNERNEC